MDENTNAGRLFALFGGLNRLAGLLGYDKSVLSRWNSRGARGGYGRVPTEYNNAIIEAGAKAGISHGLILNCLDAHTCPACERPLEPGQKVNMVRLRKYVRGK